MPGEIPPQGAEVASRSFVFGRPSPLFGCHVVLSLPTNPSAPHTSWGMEAAPGAVTGLEGMVASSCSLS